MLPANLLIVTSYENHPGRAAPRYLTPRDEVWVQKVAIACDASVGRTVGERDAELPALARAIAREHGAIKRVADGVAHVLRLNAQRRPDITRTPLASSEIAYTLQELMLWSRGGSNPLQR